ncbi:unnamed protein product [Auanema sp. JU1783]|nr:unnamed protein product [Auanema sp. JU1783]
MATAPSNKDEAPLLHRIEGRRITVGREQTGHSSMRTAILVWLTLQNSIHTLLIRYSRAREVEEMFLSTVAVFLTEVIKAVICLCLVAKEETPRKFARALVNQVVRQPRDTLKVCIPAMIYIVQNNLFYVAASHLDAATFMVTYQLKILTTAVFTVLVLHRKLSVQQWGALLFLFAGVAIVQYDQKMSNDRERLAKLNNALETTHLPINLTTVAPPPTTISMTMSTLLKDGMESFSETRTKREVNDEQNSIVGFLAVLVACFLSGFAGIYFEKILKDSDVSIWIRNIQLALPSIVFALLFAFVKDNSVIFKDGVDPCSVFTNMMFGFDWAVWVTIGISAFGGLVVAVVIKYADNILKAFATSFAIVLNCVLSFFLFDFRPTVFFLVGATFVIGAVFVYSVYPYRSKHQPVAVSEEDAELKDIKSTEGSK